VKSVAKSGHVRRRSRTLSHDIAPNVVDSVVVEEKANDDSSIVVDKYLTIVCCCC
jgi:hypothetical protein